MIFACLQAMHVSARATDDLPISFEQLPAQSQQLIKEHFSGQAIALVKMDTDILDKSYEVIFTNGNKIEFDRKGNWKEINCKHSQCPQKLIPAAIWNYVEKHFAGNKICKIEKEDWNGYEVGLSNGISLEFDSGFRLVDIDD
jgi:hypothetical protein